MARKSSMNGLAAALKAKIAQEVERVTDEVRKVGEEAELEGVSAMKEGLLAATTDWGRARVAGRAGWGKKGPREHAGRYEDGTMHDSITGEVTGPDRVDRSTQRIVVTWGWQNPKDYFMLQEHGTEKIAPAESLHYSHHKIEDQIIGRVKRIK